MIGRERELEQLGEILSRTAARRGRPAPARGRGGRREDAAGRGRRRRRVARLPAGRRRRARRLAVRAHRGGAPPSTSAASPPGSPGTIRSSRTSASSCRSSGRRPASPTARRCSKPCEAPSQRSRRASRPSSSSTTSSGRTRRRSSSCRRSPKRRRSGRCSCSAPTAARRSRAATRCGGSGSTSAAQGGSPSSSWSRSTRTGPLGSRRESSAASPARRCARRSTTARRACRSSWRSSRRRCEPAAGSRRGRAAWSSSQARAFRSRRPFATRCASEPRACRTRDEPLSRRPAVIGVEVELELLAELGRDAGLAELLDRGLLHEVEPGRAAFRHDLVREAIYADTHWPRRRSLHRELASLLEGRGAEPRLTADHWLAAGERSRALPLLVEAARRSCEVHAYRDAAAAGRAALEIWPDGADESARLDVLAQLARCAQICGEVTEAGRAWEEVADGLGGAADAPRLAEAQRQLATVYELQGASPKAAAAHLEAAHAFDAAGRHADAAAELLAAAEGVWDEDPAQTERLLDRALEAARRAGAGDVESRCLSTKGFLVGRTGRREEALGLLRSALALAVDGQPRRGRRRRVLGARGDRERLGRLRDRASGVRRRSRLLPGEPPERRRAALRRLPGRRAGTLGGLDARGAARARSPPALRSNVIPLVTKKTGIKNP